MSLNRWKDKQTVVYLDNAILLSNKKEQVTDTHTLDGSQMHYAEW